MTANGREERYVTVLCVREKSCSNPGLKLSCLKCECESSHFLKSFKIFCDEGFKYHPHMIYSNMLALAEYIGDIFMFCNMR